jgi:hypothetical protein
MDLLKTSAMLKALKLELQKYGKIEDLQAQVINSTLYLFLSLGTLDFIFILEFRYAVLSREMQH